MSDTVTPKTICRQCHGVLDASDNYCRHCGTSTAHLAGVTDGDSAAAALVVKPVVGPTAREPGWSESPWVVLSLMFLVLGPFALPLLWRSRRFTRLWKGILTIAMAALTAFLVYSMWFVVHEALAPLRELEKLQGL
jgi:hypothetical protein